MTPIKSTDYLNKANRLHRPKTVVDLSEHTMDHAAPTENGRKILTLRFDPRSGALIPRDPNLD
ncbi:MAG: hypothetical protein QNK92_15425 [Amylibacter sp.]